MSVQVNDVETEGIRARLAALESAVISDVLDETGYPAQALSSALGALVPGRRFVGKAVCVQGQPRVVTQTAVPEKAFATPYALAMTATNGSVLVVSTGGLSSGAILGGMLARDLLAQGTAALVTDGLVRDRAEIEALGLPVVCAGVTPVNGARRWAILSMTQPVVLNGQHGGAVRITPGDWLVGDADGVVVIPQAIAVEVASMAEELAKRERAIESAHPMASFAEQAQARKERFSHIRWLR